MPEDRKKIPDQLAEIPANEAAQLRQIYGDQLDKVYDSEDAVDNDEPQEGFSRMMEEEQDGS